MSYVSVALDSPTAQPFTYRLTPDTLVAAEPGALVEVPMGPRTEYGVVLERLRSVPSELKDKLRPLSRVLSPGRWAPAPTLKLARVMADYSGESLGTCLFRLLPPAGKRALYAVRSAAPRRAGRQVSVVGSHAERRDQYLALATRAKAAGRQTLVITPVIRQLWLSDAFAEAGLRTAVLSADRAPSKQRAIAQDLATGILDVVVATRHAIGWPMYALGLLIVDDPLHQAQGDDQRPYLDAATIALLRQQVEGGNLVFGLRAPVPALAARLQRSQMSQLSTSSTPPALRFVTPSQRGLLSLTALDAIRNFVEQGRPVRIVTPRHGLGSRVRCHDCDALLHCATCGDELGARSTTESLVCPSCGSTESWPATCPSCHGTQLGAIGTGDEAVRSWLKRHEPELALRVEVTTEGAFDLPSTSAGLAIFLAADSPLSSPDLLRPARYLGAIREVATNSDIIVETADSAQPWFGTIGPRPLESLAELLRERAEHQLPPYRRVLRVSGPAEAALPATLNQQVSFSERRGDRVTYELLSTPGDYRALRTMVEANIGRGWRLSADSVLEQAVV